MYLIAVVTKKLLTAYCACVICCGHTHGITKSGTRATAGVTVACSRELLNTRVYIAGVGMRVCEDTGGAITSNRVDVYFTSHKEALKFGVKRNVTVFYLRGLRPLKKVRF